MFLEATDEWRSLEIVSQRRLCTDWAETRVCDVFVGRYGVGRSSPMSDLDIHTHIHRHTNPSLWLLSHLCPQKKREIQRDRGRDVEKEAGRGRGNNNPN